MGNWFLKLLERLLGLTPVDHSQIAEWHIRLANLKNPFQVLVLLLAAAAAAYAVWWFYRREPDYCPLPRRRLMAGARIAGLLILFFILCNPVLEVFLHGFVRGKVAVLVDASQSMSRVDKFKRPEDKLVAAHMLGSVPLSETSPARAGARLEQNLNTATRLDLARALFANKEIGLLDKLQDQFDVEMFSFARAAELRRLGPENEKANAGALDGLKADGNATEIGQTLRETLKRMRGQPLAGIVLVTDGGNNKGEEPAVVAQDSPVRIYPVGIGVPESADVALTHVFMESRIFVDDLAPLSVRIKQHGFNNEAAKLTVSCDGEQLAEQAVTLRGAEQVEIIRVKPKKPGHYKYKIEIQPLHASAEDSEPSNNFKLRDVEVIDQKLNVLLLESEPRWEYRFLKNALLRDKRVACKILLRIPDLAEIARPGTPFIKEFPDKEELFKYHVIIFGNMPNDGFFTDHDFDNLRKFVMDEGGGLWFIAGKNNFPDGYKDTKLEQLLPVEFDPAAAPITAKDEQNNPITEPYRVVLTPEGRTHSLTRLDVSAAENSDEQNATLWDLVPEMYWYHKALRPKLGAAALLVHGAARESAAARREAPAPLLVVAQVGRGRVLYQAFADLWRMRYPQELGPDALERFHGQAVQYLGMPKLLGRSARVEIATDREEYTVGDHVKVTARVMQKGDLEYSSADHKTAAATDCDNDNVQIPVDLTPEPGQKGSFRGEFIITAPGKFRVTLRDEDEDRGQPAAQALFTSLLPQLEMESPDMRRDLLESVAKNSAHGRLEAGGTARMYLGDQAGEIVKDMAQARRPIDERVVNPLWDSPLLLVLFTLCMGLEWMLRKRSDLL